MMQIFTPMMGYAQGLDNNWGEGDFMKEMMGPYQYGGGKVFWQLHWVFELITWLLVIALLAGLVRWVWKKGDKR